MKRLVPALKVFCGVFFGICGFLLAFFGTMYLLISLLGEQVAAYAILVILVSIAAFILAYMEYKAPWNK